MSADYTDTKLKNVLAVFIFNQRFETIFTSFFLLPKKVQTIYFATQVPVKNSSVKAQLGYFIKMVGSFLNFLLKFLGNEKGSQIANYQNKVIPTYYLSVF